MHFFLVSFKAIDQIGIELHWFCSSTTNQESDYDRLYSRGNPFWECIIVIGDVFLRFLKIADSTVFKFNRC